MSTNSIKWQQHYSRVYFISQYLEGESLRKYLEGQLENKHLGAQKAAKSLLKKL